MAKKKKEAEVPKKVACEDCFWFVRDTEGISRTVDSGVYFMGRCKKGRNDGKAKVFASIERWCELHRSR